MIIIIIHDFHQNLEGGPMVNTNQTQREVCIHIGKILVLLLIMILECYDLIIIVVVMMMKNIQEK